jgi:alpha-beta hydrolase superfamily lysophospholipase
MRRVLLPALALAVLLVAFLGWLTRPAALAAPSGLYELRAEPRDLPALLAAGEAAVDASHGIIPGAEKRIRWAAAPGARTAYAVIYLHGFSATRQEIAPVPEQLAGAPGANLFETRLAGHGVERGALAGIRAEQWLRDGEEALAIGAALGERLILMGTSTGATLALALARHPQFAAVESLVLLSPNFGPAAAGAGVATGPFGPQLVRLAGGEERSWEPANAQQARYWTTRYPNAAVVEMMRLVDLAAKLNAQARVERAVLVYSEDDQVVSVPKFKAAFEALPATQKYRLPIADGGGPSRHVLAGDILAPENTAPLVGALTELLSAD